MWRRAAHSRDKAKEERDGFKASYELADEVAKVDDREDRDVAKIDGMGLDDVIDVLHGVMRDKPKD
jgi:hypothetical protein